MSAQPETLETLRGPFDVALDSLPAHVREVIFNELGAIKDAGGTHTEIVKLTKVRRLAKGKLGLFNGQFAGIPLRSLLRIAKAMGYKAVQLCTWGPGGVDVVKAAGDDGEAYCAEIVKIFQEEGMLLTSISDHINCQGFFDAEQVKWPNDGRLRSIMAPHLWPEDSDTDPIGTIRKNVKKHLRRCALAAKRLGVTVVNGFIGSQIWHKLFDFPPRGKNEVANAYREASLHLAEVLAYYKKLGIKFALEVHPTELVYSFTTARQFLSTLKAVCIELGEADLYDYFGFCFDPSHFPGQGLDPVKFILEFRDKIFSFHAKDALFSPAGDRSCYGDHLRMGNPDRSWLFMSGSRGSVDWALIAVALIHIGYEGEITVEWEQYEMLNFFGLNEAAEFFIRLLLYPISSEAFDAAFAQGAGGEDPKTTELGLLAEEIRTRLTAIRLENSLAA